jgi:membrane protease YdiL (CAAX protease family)
MEKILDIFLFCLLLFMPVAGHLVKFLPKKTKKDKQKNLKRGFLLSSFSYSVFLLIVFLIAPHLYARPDMALIGKGVLISEDLESLAVTVCLTPLILAIFPLQKLFGVKKDIGEEEGELFGEKMDELPAKYKEFYPYLLFMVVAVVFEELVFRQFMFISFNRVLHLRGDVLVIITTILFMAAHDYKKPMQIIAILFAGLLLGKLYLHTETVLYPIGVHLLMNIPQAVLVFKHIRKHKLAAAPPPLQ